ncbi:hypothetical protein MAPG_04535 [Magnaporthiopsis poae ATCC 64411]|uniref:Uncharacterized protein n=1 Tax=Magnaporthiopsis poae (strain ATCC 64411 / 73-15) TaxID=644358 RepID=A0A0C4DX00_MAGP6|nr:hypothetical protein MAPG_04535 [Magnaporthiopsis poae ATCC 64411]
MPSVPLKVQVGIRDHWKNEDAPVQTSLRELQELLGLQVDIEPEWPLILAELDSFYIDKGNFAAAVAGAVETWAKALTELLDDEKNEQWTEKLLEKLKESWSRLKVFVDVSKDTQASTQFSHERGGFVITLPRRTLNQPYELLPLFKGEIHESFDETKNKKKTTKLPSRSGPPPGDDWADVEVDEATGKLGIVEQTKPAAAATSSGSAPPPGLPKPEFLPNADTLPRPDELLLKPPYHLIVHAKGLTEVEVQCSHSPSLSFIADYLKRWSRANHNMTNKPPSVTVKLQQAAFGLGAMYDCLWLVAESRYGPQQTVSPTIILALVEGVLGYDKVSGDGGSWTYRRDVPFRSL